MSLEIDVWVWGLGDCAWSVNQVCTLQNVQGCVCVCVCVCVCD